MTTSEILDLLRTAVDELYGDKFPSGLNRHLVAELGYWAGTRQRTILVKDDRLVVYFDISLAPSDKSLASEWKHWVSTAELLAADVVVNCTPLGTADPPVPADEIGRNTLVVDLTYGADVTAWVQQVRASGREAVDGLGLLVHQARRSLAIWLERDVPLAPMAAAVGWPR